MPSPGKTGINLLVSAMKATEPEPQESQEQTPEPEDEPPKARRAKRSKEEPK